MEQLIQEAVVTVPRALIAETIDLVAVLSGRGSRAGWPNSPASRARPGRRLPRRARQPPASTEPG